METIILATLLIAREVIRSTNSIVVGIKHSSWPALVSMPIILEETHHSLINPASFPVGECIQWACTWMSVWRDADHHTIDKAAAV